MKRLLIYIYPLHKFYNFILSLFINYRYASKDKPSLKEETIIKYNKNRNKGPKKIICYAPFNHMYFGVDGLVSACCFNKTEIYGTLKNAGIEDIMNSNSIQSLRNKIENYNLSDGCLTCHHHLESGNYNAFVGRIYDTIIPHKATRFPTEMTFEISNTCNLECVMCDGNYSSSIRKNREKLPPLEDKYGPDFFEKIKAAVPYLKVARFQGGEPFLIPQYYEIIEYIIQQNKNCKIYIQTNGTILNERVKGIIEHKNVHLSISIDSLKKETYESIRKNASFERLVNHLEYFKLRSTEYSQYININFCVMNNNWMEVPEMVSFCNKNNFTITIIPVESPKQLSLAILNNNELGNILHFYEFPPDLDIIQSNKFNSAKYYDLIHSVKFYIEKNKAAIAEAEDKKQRIEQYDMLSISELKIKVQQIYSYTVFSPMDYEFIMNLLEENLTSLNEQDTSDFLKIILSDQNERTVNYLINDYVNKKNWKTDFKKYFEQIPLRIHKKIIVNY